jgi:hypothetical protein
MSGYELRGMVGFAEEPDPFAVPYPSSTKTTSDGRRSSRLTLS